jgi:hypothetical protein
VRELNGYSHGKAMWNAVVPKPDPRFPGLQEPGVAVALLS